MNDAQTMDWPRSPSTVQTHLSVAVDRLSRAIQRRVAVDLRALAAFRIAIGTLLIVDLIARARNLEAFYTDAGVLPRNALFSDYSTVHSLHAISGEAWVQGALFAIAGAFAVALLLGYHTRLATIVSWLLLISLHARNPMVLNSGDTLLRLLLFWGLFLPLGKRWSIDARGIDRDRDDTTATGSTIATVGTMAILLQVLLMYVINAVHKTRSELWMDGEAVVHIFQADQFTLLLGDVLADQHALLGLFTVVWMAVILLSPLLLVLAGIGRAAFASLLMSMHLGMFVTMRIGLFPLIAVAGLVLFYPPVVWDTAAAVAARVGVAAPLRRGLGRLQRGAPRLPTPGAPERPAVAELPAATRTALAAVASRGRVLFSTVVPWIVLVLVVLSNAAAVDYTEMPDPGDEVLETVEATQSWQMFAPNPVSLTKWVIAPGELEDGTEVDALHGGDVDWDRPPSIDEYYDTARERKYRSNMRYAGNENHHSYFANSLCERWNRTHETGLERVTVYGLTDKAGPYEDEPDVAEYELIEYDCSGAFIQNE